MITILICVAIVSFAIVVTAVGCYLIERHDDRKYKGGYEHHFMLYEFTGRTRHPKPNQPDGPNFPRSVFVDVIEFSKFVQQHKEMIARASQALCKRVGTQPEFNGWEFREVTFGEDGCGVHSIKLRKATNCWEKSYDYFTAEELLAD